MFLFLHLLVAVNFLISPRLKVTVENTFPKCKEPEGMAPDHGVSSQTLQLGALWGIIPAEHDQN